MMTEQKIPASRIGRYYQRLEPLMAKPEAKAYTMLALSFFTIAFFGFFAIRPTLTTIGQLRRQISDSQTVDEKLQEKINSLSAAQLAYEAIKPDLGIITAALPSDAQFPSFVKGLENISTASGVKVNNLGFQTIELSSKKPVATASASETAINFSLNVTGEYNQLTDFVRRLSFLERLATIDTMILSFQTVEEKKELQLLLKGKIYYVN